MTEEVSAYEIREGAIGHTFEVWEKGFKPICLEKGIASKEAAEQVIEKWKAYDTIADRTQDFLDEQETEFGSILSSEEIRGHIKDSIITG